MVKTELREIFRLGKITTLINTEYGELESILEEEIDRGLDELECRKIQSCGIEKEVTGSGTRNVGVEVNFRQEILLKTEIKMEASAGSRYYVKTFG